MLQRPRGRRDEAEVEAVSQLGKHCRHSHVTAEITMRQRFPVVLDRGKKKKKKKKKSSINTEPSNQYGQRKNFFPVFSSSPRVSTNGCCSMEFPATALQRSNLKKPASRRLAKLRNTGTWTGQSMNR